MRNSKKCKRKRTYYPYMIEEDMPTFETGKFSLLEKNSRQITLAKSKKEKFDKLERKLAECGEVYFCGSPICPECKLEKRKELYSQTRVFMENRGVPKIITLIYYDSMMSNISAKRIKKIIMRLRKTIKRYGFTDPVIGTVEFDFHEQECMWLPHFHLLVFGENPPIEKLRILFNKMAKKLNISDRKLRPVLEQRLRDPAKQISYVFKMYSMCVKVYEDSEGKRRTKKFRLNDMRQRAALRVVDELGFSGLVFKYGVREKGGEFVDSNDSG